MSDDPFESIIALIEQGKMTEAQNMLKRILSSDRHNLTAWYWYAKTYATDDERIRVLELCLQYNPNSEPVRQALHKFQSRSSKISMMEKDQTENSIIDTVLGKFGLIAGAIVIAMVVAAFVTVPMAILLPYIGLIFPSGLIYTIQVILRITGQNIMPDKDTSGNSILLGWLIYLGISIPAILTKKREVFFILYIILIVFLLANIAGCQANAPDISGSW